MSTPPPAKRQKQDHPGDIVEASGENVVPNAQPPITQKAPRDISPPPPLSAGFSTSTVQISPISPGSPTSLSQTRKRQRTTSPRQLNLVPPGTLPLPQTPQASAGLSIPQLMSEESGSKTLKKPGRTNTPWTAVEEQRLKRMRDVGNSWGEIAKAFPNRTEGSVKKHWYKDMHYAEFAEDESIALRDAIREYEANKWKAIGAKLGKPAKACEQYAREHFKNL